jgi:predicted nucleotidyltransferase
MNAIRRVVNQIVSRFAPRQVILFGSRAWGKARPDSDVDLLIVTNRPAGPDASLRIRRGIEYAFPLDLIVCDSKRLGDRVAAGDFFLGDAVRRGRVLYENSDR